RCQQRPSSPGNQTTKKPIPGSSGDGFLVSLDSLSREKKLTVSPLRYEVRHHHRRAMPRGRWDIAFEYRRGTRERSSWNGPARYPSVVLIAREPSSIIAPKAIATESGNTSVTQTSRVPPPAPGNTWNEEL